MHVYVTLVLFALAASIAKARGRFLTTEGTQSSVPSQSPSAATTIDAIVGYHNSQGLALIRSVGYNLVDLSVIHAVACKVSPTDYQQLQLDSNIAWIEPDRLVFPTTIHTAAATINDGEVVPYGITLIQGQQELRGGNIFRASTTTLRNTTNSFSCQDPSSMKIGLVDSGYSVGHPDLPCATEVSPNCMGRTFAHSLGLAETAPWFVDDSGHGTHVAGVIGALGDNDVGVVGILPDGDFCFVISRIFGRLGPSPVSTLIQALAWNAEMKTKVINLSLGSPVHSIALDKMVEYLHQSGIIVVAAAGNTANKNESIWPANHPTVISVGAVDKSLHKAPFSAGPTDFVAPGVRILSTTPMGSDGFVYIEIVDGPVVEASYMFGSDPVAGSSFNHKHNQRSFQNIGMMDVAGPLVECPNFGLSICPGPVGHVCIIERGVNYFDQKVDNCEMGGGIAAVIYNNQKDGFSGSLALFTNVTIPAVAISGNSGKVILDSFLGYTATLTGTDGYAYYDGTSMAAPHISGSYAKVWRDCPLCSALQLTDCFKSTALGIEKQGQKASPSGNGLVQIVNAYSCLKRTGCCAT